MYQNDLERFIELFSSFTKVNKSTLTKFLRDNNVTELLSRPTDVTLNPKSLEAIENLRSLRNLFDNLKSYDREYKLTSPKEACDYFKNRFADIRDKEYFSVTYLDTKNRVIDSEIIFKGTINASAVFPREIFKNVLMKNAQSVLFGHNHPSGICDPSKEDIAITRRLIEAGNIFNISVLDHVIVGGTNYYSMRENNDFVFENSFSNDIKSGLVSESASEQYMLKGEDVAVEKKNSTEVKMLYEMIGYKLDDKLCFTTFEMLENEFEKGNLFENIKAFSNLPDEEKQLMANDFEVNFKQYQDNYEWDEFYRDNVAIYEQITEIINFEHTDISVDGHSGRWHSVMEVPNRWQNEFKIGEPFYLVKHDTLDIPYAIINEELRVIAHEAPNGFRDLDMESQISNDEEFEM